YTISHQFTIGGFQRMRDTIKAQIYVNEESGFVAV
ncbi:MAG: hypothetical protein RLZZ384_925, partial [Pseudomonadota bacterium]